MSFHNASRRMFFMALSASSGTSGLCLTYQLIACQMNSFFPNALRCKVVQHRAAGADLLDAVAIIDTAAVRVESSVARYEVNASRGVRGQTSTAHPNAATHGVGSDVICT